MNRIAKNHIPRTKEGFLATHPFDIQGLISTVDGWLLSRFAELCYTLNLQTKTTCEILEIGTYQGLSSAYMMDALVDLDSPDQNWHFLLCDTFKQDNINVWIKEPDGTKVRKYNRAYDKIYNTLLVESNLKNWETKYNLFVGKSSDLYHIKPMVPWSGVFIDGEHTQPQFKQDLEYALMTTNGPILCHDIFDMGFDILPVLEKKRKQQSIQNYIQFQYSSMALVIPPKLSGWDIETLKTIPSLKPVIKKIF